MTIEEKRRELFEAWAIDEATKRKYPFMSRVTARHSDGSYATTWVDSAWIGFNAAIDAVEIEFPESCAWESLDSAMQFVFLTYEAGETGPDSVELCRRNDCIKAIESTGLGLKVKS